MRIGILTLPLHTNYGGILQAYALQTVLERMGHEVKIIHLPFVRPSASFKIKVKRFLKKMLGRFSGYINFEEKSNQWLPFVAKNINTFMDAQLNLARYNDYSDISETDFDCICVGSDQIWRPRMLLYNISNAYLSFASNWNIKRIAYSVSFGTDEWEYSEEETSICKSLVKKFNAVSVRELGGVNLCQYYLNINAMHTLDPTLLLDADDYKSLIKDHPCSNNSKILFSYVLDVTIEKAELIENFAKYKGMDVSKINVEMGNKKCELSKRILPSVEYWLKSFRDSDFIITDSFHACVFSILFKKPFAVMVNNVRGAARFSSLLSMFGLEDRIVSSLEDLKKLNAIDYTLVYSKLEAQKQLSYNFLSKSLC